MKIDYRTLELWKPIDGVTKSYTIFAKVVGENGYMPVLRLVKPRWMSEKEYKELVSEKLKIIYREGAE